MQEEVIVREKMVVVVVVAAVDVPAVVNDVADWVMLLPSDTVELWGVLV